VALEAAVQALEADMTAPSPTTAPEGGSETGGSTAEDEAAQQALAAAAQEAGDSEDENDDDKWDEASARRKWEKSQREAHNLRKQLAELKPLAEEAEKRRKGEQSESQRLAEEKASLEVQLAELTTANVRRDAAEAANLPAKFVKFITAADPDEALAQAKELAKELKAANEPRNGSANLGQGARGAHNAGVTESPDSLLRRMAGRG